MSTIAKIAFVLVVVFLLATAKMDSAVANFYVAARKKAAMDVSSIASAVETYTIDHGRAPASLEALVTPDANGRTYLKDRTTVPTDPWNNQYGYEPPIGERGFRVFSFAHDGKPGGEGDDADIDNLTGSAAPR
jgi:general secretion pathway protein G